MSSWKILYGFKNAGYKLQVHVTGYRVQGTGVQVTACGFFNL